MSVSNFDSTEHELTKPEVRHFSIDAVKTVYARLVVAFRPEFARIGLGTDKGPLGMGAAVLLSQGFYWSEAIGDEDGKFTVTQEEIEHATTLNEYEQRVARRELVSRGLWGEEKRGEEYEDSRGRKRMSGGRMFYEVHPEAVRVALELLVEMTPGLDDERRRKKDLKEQQRREWLEQKKAEKLAEKEAKRLGSATSKAQVHVSQNLKFTNIGELSEGNVDLCIANFEVHETQDLQVMKLENCCSFSYIEEQQQAKELIQDKQQSATQTLPNGATQDVVDFLHSLNVVVEGDSNANDEAEDDLGEDVSVLVKDLMLEANLSREQAVLLIEHHGAHICDAALDSPGAIERLLKTLLGAVPAAFPAPKSAVPVKPKPAPALTAQNALSGADLEPLVAARLLQIGVKRGPIKNCIQKHGVEYAAAVLQGFEAGHINGNAPAAVVTSLLNDGTYKPRVGKVAATVEGGLAEARSEAENAQKVRDADQIESERIDAQNASLDKFWSYLNEKTQIRIEMIANAEMKFLDESLRTETTFMTLRRTLQRAANEGKLEEAAAALKAAREA